MTTLSTSQTTEGAYILIDSSEKPFLRYMDEDHFNQLKKTFDACSGLVWVTFEGQIDPENDPMGAVSGFLRSLRTESGLLPYIMMDIGGSDWDLDMKNITHVFNMHFGKSRNLERPPEFEYASRQGNLMIPRLVPDQAASQKV